MMTISEMETTIFKKETKAIIKIKKKSLIGLPLERL